MKPILNIATRAARNAGAYLLRERERIDSPASQEALEGLLQQTEQVMIEAITKVQPKHGILGTFHPSINAEAETLWHLQMVSGELNLRRNIPQVAIVLVITVKGNPEHALVFEPYTDEIFTASLGGGAQCNRYRLRSSGATHLKKDSVMVFYAPTGFSLAQKLAEEDVQVITSVCPAIAMAYVAAGRYDGFVGEQLSLIEMMAGTLMIQETGGLITDLSGGHDSMEKREMLACAPKLLKTLVQMKKERGMSC